MDRDFGRTGAAANPKAHFIKGAFLVSPSDADNPFVTMERSRFFANAWGAHIESVGCLGHINAKSNLGEWEQGRKFLAEFEKTL